MNCVAPVGAAWLRSGRFAAKAETDARGTCRSNLSNRSFRCLETDWEVSVSLRALVARLTKLLNTVQPALGEGEGQGMDPAHRVWTGVLCERLPVLRVTVEHFLMTIRRWEVC
jgi:hypothetical protein